MLDPQKKRASLTVTMAKVYSFGALFLIFTAVVTLIIKLTQPLHSGINFKQRHSFVAPHETQLSALAIEGRDVFKEQGCHYCHTKKIQNTSLILAGALFAPRFPFQDQSMTQPQMRQYLAGQERQEFQKINHKSDQTQEPVVHQPGFSFLEKNKLTGIQTQAKMIVDPKAQQTRDILVEASQSIAGASQLDALIAYLHETSFRR